MEIQPALRDEPERAPKQKREWDEYVCSVPICRTVIRVLKGSPRPTVCKWHHGCSQQPAQPLHGHVPVGPPISKDTFGAALYDTIRTIGGILAIRENITYAIAHHGSITEYQRMQEELTRWLHDQMPRLGEEDVIEIVRHYPWVAYV